MTRAIFRRAVVWISFVTQGKELRRDLERTGNAYLEVVRNVADEIVFLLILGRWL